jgi:hypothetical protein
MIVDDVYIIVGSANINQVSLQMVQPSLNMYDQFFYTSEVNGRYKGHRDGHRSLATIC